jgi:hypothetical protein
LTMVTDTATVTFGGSFVFDVGFQSLFYLLLPTHTGNQFVSSFSPSPRSFQQPVTRFIRSERLPLPRLAFFLTFSSSSLEQKKKTAKARRQVCFFVS